MNKKVAMQVKGLREIIASEQKYIEEIKHSLHPSASKLNQLHGRIRRHEETIMDITNIVKVTA